MFSKLLLTATAVFLCLLGLALDFLPQEAAALLKLPALAAILVLFQVVAAFCLGLGYLNWLSRHNLIGGIYSRPLGLANVLAFGVAAIPLDRALLRGSLASTQPAILLAVACLFTAFALAYLYALFLHDPLPSTEPANDSN